MGLFDAISSFFSGVASAIGSICSALGGPLGTALVVGLTALNPILGLIVAAIPLITKIIDILLPKEINPQDIESGKLAVMAEECPDIKPENYETVPDYIKALNEKVDHEKVNAKMETLTPEQKTAYQLVSLAMIGPLVAEKLDAKDGEFDLAFIAKANLLSLSPEKAVAFMKDLQAEGVSTTDANKYLEGALSGDDLEKAAAGMKAALEKLDTSLKTDEQKEAFLINWSEKIDTETVKQNN
jgi:hypothetical protein